MLLRALHFTRFFFSNDQTRNIINHKLKQALYPEQVMQVFKTYNKQFDDVHHLLFLKKYLLFQRIADNNVMPSIVHLQQKLSTMNNTTFSGFFYYAIKYHLNVSIQTLNRQILKRNKRFNIKNVNMILLTIKNHKSKFQNYDNLVEVLTQNINLSNIKDSSDLIYFFQNVNEAGKISKSLNKGILGKLTLMQGWHNLQNFNQILSVILGQNLQQNITFMEKQIEQVVSSSFETRNLVILLHYLSKFHKPNMILINKVFNRIKYLGQFRKTEISKQYFKISEQQSNNQQTKTQQQHKPISINKQNKTPEQFGILSAINILISMNRLQLFDDQMFQIAQQVFFTKINQIQIQNFILFLNAHRSFVLRLIQKVGIQNKDYNRKINKIKDYYNNFYAKVFTFYKTKLSINISDVYQTLKAAHGLYFTSNQTKELAITLANQKLDKRLLTEQKIKGLFEILESYKRLPHVIEDMKKRIQDTEIEQNK